MSGRVLIIDDEANSVMLLETFLKDTASEIRSLKDPTRFEETIAEFSPDIVLLDYHMPQIDGMEVLRRIRSDEFSKEYLPVVVLTSDTTRAARNSALVLGADDFLTKPLDRNEVVLRVRNMLRTRELYVQLARATEAAERRADLIAQQSEQNFRLVFESHPEPMWVYDLDTLAFLEVNDAAIKRYGFSRDEFLGMTIRDIRPPDQVPALRQSVKLPDVLQRSGPWVHRTKDRRLLEVEITSHTLAFSGRRARFVMAQDVTERRRLERQVNQSQRLESLGQLAGGVAHDFNNLLSVILNFAQFSRTKVAQIADTTGSAALAGAVEDMERVEKAAKSAASLTRQLLTFARREVVQPKVVAVNEVVRELEPLLRRTLGEHIEFVTSLAADLRPVLIDTGQLEQVLTNLVINARDAMKEGGRLNR